MSVLSRTAIDQFADLDLTSHQAVGDIGEPEVVTAGVGPEKIERLASQATSVDLRQDAEDLGSPLRGHEAPINGWGGLAARLGVMALQSSRIAFAG